MGAGEGTDNLDFLADLSALKVIGPDSVPQAVPQGDKPVPKSNSLLLEQLRHESIPYAHCAWCSETPKTRGMLEALLRDSSCGVATVMLCSTISVSDHYGHGVAVEADELRSSL